MPGSRLFDALASLRLAVVTMVTLGAVCSWGTFYEMNHGTPAAQRDVYRTWWFALILATLGANIFCAMMKRYPWKKHHTGFVLAHIGILTLLAGSLLSLHLGLDGNLALYEGETGRRVALLDKALQVALPDGKYASFPVVFEKDPPRPGRERRFAVADTGVTLVAEDFLTHVTLRESFEEATDGPPALHFVLDAPFAREQSWLSAADSARAHVDFGPAAFGFHVARTAAEAAALTHEATGKNNVSFVLDPGGDLLYRLTTKEGRTTAGKVEVGRPIATPWMGMKVVVDRFLARAAPQRTVSPAPPPEKDERRLSAVKVHLEGPNVRTEPDWVVWTEARKVAWAGQAATVAYRAPEVALPFQVQLMKFNSDKYPGSNMAATYESWVRVDDPERGVSEHHISMNHPLHYRGYIFFQASFVEGEPMMSIFSVARSPGLPLVYVGVSLISLGVLWMFYVKPMMARRDAARALQAHKERENRNEAPSADVARGRAGPAEPASSGA
jgi:ResB-like family